MNNIGDSIKKGIPPDCALAIPYYDNISLDKLVYYLAVMRTDPRAQSFYLPKGKVQAQVHYFCAQKSPVLNRAKWDDYTKKPIIFHDVNGNHFSIFKPDDVSMFAEKFNISQKA